MIEQEGLKCGRHPSAIVGHIPLMFLLPSSHIETDRSGEAYVACESILWNLGLGLDC